MILITGTPRSGTTYISKLLKKAGIDLDHEMTLGKDGIASWPLASGRSKILRTISTPDKYGRTGDPWGPQVEPTFFSHKIHQIRHPLSYISNDPFSCLEESRSLIVEVLGPEKFSSDITTTNSKDDLLFFHMVVWHEWNLMAEDLCDWSYRIESLSEVVEDFVVKIGSPDILEKLKKEIKGLPKNINSRKKLSDYNLKNEMTWLDLENCDKNLAQKIKDQTVRYGYNLARSL